MRIDNIHLRNFRCYEELTIDFHPRFNVLVGINGTGKTSILEAVRIAAGSIFYGVDKYKAKIMSPSIQADDVRLWGLEQQYPVSITTRATLDSFLPDASSATVQWARVLETKGGSTRFVDAEELKAISRRMQKAIRDPKQNVRIPLVAYYSTDRFKKEKKNAGIIPDGSRLRGYFNALDPQTNIKFFLNLYFTETLSALQHGKSSEVLSAVNEAVKKCVDCDDLLFDIKRQELLLIQHGSHERMPFHLLSDGIRSTLALVMEIAFRCYLLNPHLGAEAALRTAGIVMIDELDLHLHPEWQKRIANDLRKAFPCVQFIVTTHAPLVIGSINDAKIFSVKENEAFDFPLQYGKDANYILNELGTTEMNSVVKETLNDYFIQIETGRGKTAEALALRDQLEKLLGKDHTELQRADMMLRFF